MIQLRRVIKLINQEKLNGIIEIVEKFLPEKITDEHRNMTHEIFIKWLEKQLKRLSNNRKGIIRIKGVENIVYISYLTYYIEDYFEEHNMDMLDTTILQGEEYDGVFAVHSFEYSGKEYVVTSSVTGSYLIDKARYGKFFGFGKGKFREVKEFARI